jgi:hypothetical protein
MKRLRGWFDIIGLVAGAAVFLGFLTMMAVH